MIFKVLFPSWKFFDRAGPTATLFYKLSGTSNSEWVSCPAPPKRNFLNLILNPKGNVFLAMHGLIDNLVTDINSMSNETTGAQAITEAKSYKLVVRLIQFLLKEQGIKNNSFYFKVNVKTDKEVYDAITSDEIIL